MNLLLKLDVTVDESRRGALERLQTVIDVSIADHSGRSLCRAAGSPAKGLTKDGWVLTTSAHEAAFWHFGCSEIKLKRSESYTLKIRIRDVDPSTPKIKLTPTFQLSNDFWP